MGSNNDGEVIEGGGVRPRRSRMVGAIDERLASVAKSIWRCSLLFRGDQNAGDGVGRVRGHRTAGGRVDFFFGVAVIGDDEG